MSRLSATTPACRTEPGFQLTLAPAPAESWYRFLLAASVILLPAGVIVHYALWQTPIPFLLVFITGFYALWQLRSAFNAALSAAFGSDQGECWLRCDGRQLWLGANDRWTPLDVLDARLYGAWLAVLQGRVKGVRCSVWFFNCAADAGAHRRLRIWINSHR